MKHRQRIYKRDGALYVAFASAAGVHVVELASDPEHRSLQSPELRRQALQQDAERHLAPFVTRQVRKQRALRAINSVPQVLADLIFQRHGRRSSRAPRPGTSVR